ncbi:MAG: GNAT family N-acetyltransferase [Clostridia bacterium]|nr:GNAT family N-acetyltransferase [Clostridia bacterium]
MNKVSYRKAQITDLNWLVDVEQRCFNKADAFSKRQLQWMIKNPNDSIIMDIIEWENNLIGYAVYFTRRGSKIIRLYSVCTSWQFVGQGFTKIYLYNRLVDLAENFIKVTLEVRVSNQKAIDLYASLGFIVRNILKEYYDDGEDAYQMVIELNKLSIKF